MEKTLSDRSTKKDLWDAYQKLFEMKDEEKGGTRQEDGDGKKPVPPFPLKNVLTYLVSVLLRFSMICGKSRLT
ncbi:MAG: hypothetical protein G01um101448_523 [Parcubacteria group bacterium Gr01-1014_48]|nr:MAG: hypothetical protein Greene041614_181 [Parcubacteria group bacterium Greene0416_14]TSC73834.1 MAG: hypothetical protein G01um101448_523 [Parcubacteria group bacterium Gr01-1014_48]TSD01215.1 MAG: hypothetical protein Greene101415_410 [Parcubacteria group bacterium Greene1014_15]TSD07309.1 MAG: hypothetical protein Greene07144_942 [Parcubacteria group bacterium Greene0714_4]